MATDPQERAILITHLTPQRWPMLQTLSYTPGFDPPLNQFAMETSGFEGTSTLVSVGHLGCMHLEKTVIQIISKISLHIETYRHTEKFPLWGDICSDFISSDLFGGRGEENRPHSSVEIWAPATWPVSFGTVIWPLLYIDPVRRSHGVGGGRGGKRMLESKKQSAVELIYLKKRRFEFSQSNCGFFFFSLLLHISDELCLSSFQTVRAQKGRNWV